MYLIQHRDNELLLSMTGGWTDKIVRVREFKSVDIAQREAIRLGLTDYTIKSAKQLVGELYNKGRLRMM